MPPFVGRPARLVGEPAGGNLSADTYKVLGTVFLPAIVSYLSYISYNQFFNVFHQIPFVWDRSLQAAMDEHERLVTSYPKRLKAWEKKFGDEEGANEARKGECMSFPSCIFIL